MENRNIFDVTKDIYKIAKDIGVNIGGVAILECGEKFLVTKGTSVLDYWEDTPKGYSNWGFRPVSKYNPHAPAYMPDILEWLEGEVL